MTQAHKSKQDSTSKAEQTKPVEAKDLKNEDLAADIDDILDEIDEVLEENAQEFVSNFIQKGGE